MNLMLKNQAKDLSVIVTDNERRGWVCGWEGQTETCLRHRFMSNQERPGASGLEKMPLKRAHWLDHTAAD